MKHNTNCPACVAADKLNVTGQAERELLHAVADLFVGFTQIQRRAAEIDFELTDDVVDQVAECIGEAAADEPQGLLN